MKDNESKEAGVSGKPNSATQIKKKNSEGYIEMARDNPWIITSVVLAVLLLLVVVFGTTIFNGKSSIVSGEVAGENLIKFINSQGLGNATFVSAAEENGLYKVTVNFNEKDIPVYVTLDGSQLIGSQMPLAVDQSQITGQATSEVEPTILKSDKPKVELFVMSFCPYGNQAEETMLPVYKILNDSVDWNIHFIVSVSGNNVDSLHGPVEVSENEREVCIIKNYGIGTWFTFVSYVNNKCGSDGSCWQDAAKAAKVDVNKINTCVTSKGLEYMKAEAAASNAAGASGSPTLFINGVQTSAVYQYGNSEAYKQAICSAFNSAPAACSSNTLSASSTTSAASGSCG